MNMVTFRQAATSDASAIHALISDNLEVGHLLPRTMDDIVAHAARFIVAEWEGRVIACAELAPLSKTVVEITSGHGSSPSWRQERRNAGLPRCAPLRTSPRIS